jgi:hypothetical protein
MEAVTITAAVATVALLLQTTLLDIIVRRGLASHPVLKAQLLVAPNRWLLRPVLRLRYFLSFRALPEGSHALEPWVRATLLAARLSGLIFLCGILVIFVAALIDAFS